MSTMSIPAHAPQRRDPRPLYYPQLRSRGFTDDGRSVIFHLRVNSLPRPGEPRPLPDAFMSLAVRSSLAEHVDDPDPFFSEPRRLLRPGGHLCMCTTKLLSCFGPSFPPSPAATARGSRAARLASRAVQSTRSDHAERAG